MANCFTYKMDYSLTITSKSLSTKLRLLADLVLYLKADCRTSGDNMFSLKSGLTPMWTGASLKTKCSISIYNREAVPLVMLQSYS